jgi:methenyltetrahydromethanopterin cyclohydrolase
LLKVGINEGNIFAAGMLHAGIKTGFLAKVTGKTDDLDGAFLRGVEFSQIGGVASLLPSSTYMIS